MRQIGKMSGVSSGHLSVSRTRGVMPPAAVFGVAQAYGLDPLEEIARFPSFEIAWPAPKLKAWNKTQNRKQSLMSEPIEDPAPETDGAPEISFEGWITATLSMCERAAGARGSTFCPEWWKHPEAVARFKALYIQYGHAIEDGEVSGWWIQHWDPHMRALCDPDVGPFRRCAFGHAEPKETVHLMVATPEVGDPDYEAAISSPDPRWYLSDEE